MSQRPIRNDFTKQVWEKWYFIVANDVVTSNQKQR